MPIVTIEALEGRTVDQKRKLVNDVTEAVVKHYNVAPEAVTVVLRDIIKENLGKAGKLRIDQ